MSAISCAAAAVSVHGEKSLSLFDTLLPLPGSIERKKIDELTRLPLAGYVGAYNFQVVVRRPKEFQEEYRMDLRLLKLFLRVTLEASQAFIEHRYSAYDALIKNFGCQMTASEVFHLSKKKELYAEAVRTHESVSKALKELEGHLKKPPLGEHGMDLVTYLQKVVKIDIYVSPDMARLIRLCLLCLVRDYKAVKRDHLDEEIFVTRVNKLYPLVAKQLATSSLTKCMDLMVQGIQAEESKQAIVYIRKKAVELGQRARPVLLRCLGQKFECDSNKGKYIEMSPIITLPLLYNTEASIRSLSGIILIKNKAKFCDKQLEDVKAVKLFLRYPEERVLTNEEMSQLSENDSLVVIEGYIKKEETDNVQALQEKILSIGLMTIIQVNCALAPQYVEIHEKEAHRIDDEEANHELSELAKKQEIKQLFRLDHIYTASVKEEK